MSCCDLPVSDPSTRVIDTCGHAQPFHVCIRDSDRGLKLTQQTLLLLSHLSPSLLLLTHYEFQKNREAEQLSLFFS